MPLAISFSVADGPEQVRVLPRARGGHRPVGEHDLRRPQMVDGKPVLAGQPAESARGGQAADADSAVVTRAQRPPVRRQGGGDIHPPGARPEPHPPGGPVQDLDRVQGRDVDDDAAVIGRAAADPVAAAADGQGAPRC
jgi:hypothetical protein